MPSLGEYPDELSLSHQNWRLGSGDRRGAAGRMSAAQGWRAQRLSHPCRPGLSRVITPILASLGVFLVRKTHCHRRCSRVHRPRHLPVVGDAPQGARARGRGRGRPPAGPRAVLVLRWMVAGTALTTLARDSRVSWATAYRYLLRGPGRDRGPGPGPSRGPSATARVEGAERRPGRDPDPHRPGGPGATRTRAATCGIRARPGPSGATCRW